MVSLAICIPQHNKPFQTLSKYRISKDLVTGKALSDDTKCRKELLVHATLLDPPARNSFALLSIIQGNRSVRRSFGSRIEWTACQSVIARANANWANLFICQWSVVSGRTNISRPAPMARGMSFISTYHRLHSQFHLLESARTRRTLRQLWAQTKFRTHFESLMIPLF
jgi:hypothetical protein